MVDDSQPVLPLQAALEALEQWQKSSTPANRRAVRHALGRVVTSYGAHGAYLVIGASPLPEFETGVGSIGRRPAPATLGRLSRHDLLISDGSRRLGTIWLDVHPDRGHAVAEQAARAVAMAIDAAWSRAEARAAGKRLAALDAAVRGIAGVLSVDRVLQLIVDRVRDLADAQYAALGIVGANGHIERFVTSGISAEQRALIGPLPRGHGLLGLIIRENRSIVIDDIAADERGVGFPPHHPEMHSFLGVPVRSQGHTTGNLYLTNKQHARGFSEDDRRLVEMFGLHAGIAIENARLHEEVQRLAVIEDRHRISQDLHDGIIQSLYAIALALEDAADAAVDDPLHTQQKIDRSIDSLHQTTRDIRNFIMGLRPELLDEADLATGIRTLATEFRLNTMVDLEIHLAEPLPRLTPDAAGHLLSMTREGLSNVARHAGATRATLQLGADNGTLTLVIGDNGRGFDTRRSRHGGQGLGNLQSRAEALGGSLVVRSEPGAGTRLEARVPTTDNAALDTEEAADDG
jgi:signal transduction histidine kinase